MSAAPANIVGSPLWWMSFLLGRVVDSLAMPMEWWMEYWGAGSSARFSWLKLAPSILPSCNLIPPETPILALTGRTWLAIRTTFTTQARSGGIRTYLPAPAAPRDKTLNRIRSCLIAQTQKTSLAALATQV